MKARESDDLINLQTTAERKTNCLKSLDIYNTIPPYLIYLSWADWSKGRILDKCWILSKWVILQLYVQSTDKLVFSVLQDLTNASICQCFRSWGFYHGWRDRDKGENKTGTGPPRPQRTARDWCEVMISKRVTYMCYSVCVFVCLCMYKHIFPDLSDGRILKTPQ